MLVKQNKGCDSDIIVNGSWFVDHGLRITVCASILARSHETAVHVLLIPCLLGVYTRCTRYCANNPEGVARGFINTLPSVSGIHPVVGME